MSEDLAKLRADLAAMRNALASIYHCVTDTPTNLTIEQAIACLDTVKATSQEALGGNHVTLARQGIGH